MNSLFQRIEMRAPETTVAGKPRVNLGQPSRVDRVHPALRVRPRAYQTGISQRSQVLRNGRLGQRESPREVAGRALAIREQFDDSAPRRVGQGSKSLHGRSIAA